MYLVLYKGKPFILINNKGVYHEDFVLDWYAKKYALKRQDLSILNKFPFEVVEYLGE